MRLLPLLRASGLLLAFSTLWFAVNLAYPVGPAVLLWLPIPVGAAILTVVLWQISRTRSLLEPTRRFWRHLCFAAVLVGIAITAQAVDVLMNPDLGGPRTGPVMLSFGGAALVVVVYALYRLPFGHQTRGERFRVALDASTVLLATALLMWHLQIRWAPGDDSTVLWATMIITAVALVAVLTAAKVMLSSDAYIDKSALRLLALAMAIGAGAPIFQPLLSAWPSLFPTQVSVPAVFFLACWAGERQRTARVGPRRGALEERRRSFSVLPYGSVAVVDGLLVWFTWKHGGLDERMIVGTVVLITGLVVLRQITAFQDNGRLLGRLDHGATHDSLTQLPNRTLFGERLNKALTTAGHRPVSVALIDLDDFKEVNDTLGHEVGDLLLIEVAQRLAACVRTEDTVARLGGDEFVVVLDGADPAAADLAAERMIDALRQPVMADGHELPIRASIGIADGHTGDEASVLLRRADIAMYRAKNVNGTAYLHYEGAMAATVTEHAHLGAELREAIAGNQLFLLYQPIVALDDGRLMGAEALVRWAHPVRGTMAPDSFIPVAERTGLIVPLSRWVMREACRQLAAWTAVHGDGAPAVINVNISARDLREPDFAGDVAEVLIEFGISPDRIVLEVTETMVLELGTSIPNLDRLRAMGIRISLDDFGTGHSTLTLLHECPVDEIKLDRSFVQAEVDGRPTMAAAVIHLAQALGLHAVAEGVETAEQAEQLLSLGYLAAQGYLFARPMLPAAFDTLLYDPKPLTPAAVAPNAWEMSA